MAVTVDDLIARWRALSAEEITQATLLIGDYEAELRLYAADRGVDLEAEIEASTDFERVYTAVVCSAVSEAMRNNSNEPVMSQMSQSALGMSVSGTFLNPGGGLFIRNNLLKQLGLLKQKIKAVDLYADDDD